MPPDLTLDERIRSIGVRLRMRGDWTVEDVQSLMDLITNGVDPEASIAAWERYFDTRKTRP